MVSARAIRRLVTALTCLQVVLAVLIAAAGWSIINPKPPFLKSQQVEPQSPDAPIEAAANRRDLPPLETFAVLWQRDLRQPLTDPVAKPDPTPTPTPKRPLPRLLSTFVSGERDLAQIAPVSGPPRIVGLNETIDGYNVSAIETGRLLLRHGKNEYWIEIQRSEPLIAERR